MRKRKELNHLYATKVRYLIGDTIALYRLENTLKVAIGVFSILSLGLPCSKPL